MTKSPDTHLEKELELELKLGCNTATADALIPHLTQLCAQTPKRLQLQNTYFDTADGQLRQHKMALRLRQQGALTLQTVKCSGHQHGGMSSRPEWETPYSGHFDFGAVSDSTVKALLNDNQHKLQPTLNTHFERLRWLYQTGETKVEVVLDRGAIEAGTLSTPICELELELLGGSTSVIFSLALQLAQNYAVFPSPLSKATRGNDLITPVPVPAINTLAALATPALFDVLCQYLPDNTHSDSPGKQALVRAALDVLQQRSASLKQLDLNASSLIGLSQALYEGSIQ